MVLVGEGNPEEGGAGEEPGTGTGTGTTGGGGTPR